MTTRYFILEKHSHYNFKENKDMDVYYNIIKSFKTKKEAIDWIVKLYGKSESYYRKHTDEFVYKVMNMDEVVKIAKLGNIANL